MKRSRFSEERIIGILKEQEAGMATAEACRRHGVSPATFYWWKSTFGGLEVSEAKRLRSLEDENAKLKKLRIHPAAAPLYSNGRLACSYATAGVRSETGRGQSGCCRFRPSGCHQA